MGVGGVTFIELTNSSSMLVWHFSRFILFMATRSCLGIQRAACTTAVAPLPGIATTTQQWQSRQEQEQHTQWKECTRSTVAQHPDSGPLILFTRVCVYAEVFIIISHACFSKQGGLFIWVFTNQTTEELQSLSHHGVTSQMAEQLPAADKERYKMQKTSRQQRSQRLTTVVLLLISNDTTSQVICTTRFGMRELPSLIFSV